MGSVGEPGGQGSTPNNLKHENMLDTTFSRCNSERVNIDINSDADSVIEEEVKPLSRTELRNKRLAFFNK